MAKFGFCFGGESVGKQFLTEFDVITRVRVWVGSCESLLGPSLHLGRHLAESIFLIVAIQALLGSFVGTDVDSDRGGVLGVRDSRSTFASLSLGCRSSASRNSRAALSCHRSERELLQG